MSGGVALLAAPGPAHYRRADGAATTTTTTSSSSPVQQQQQQQQQPQPGAPDAVTQASPPATAAAATPAPPLKLAAAAASFTALAAAAPLLHHTLQSLTLPPLQQAGAAALSAVAVAAAGLRLTHGREVHVELHRGRVHLQLGVPSSGPLVSPGSIVTRPTGDARGNGAFAVLPIRGGTWLGDYSGDVLDLAAFDARYPDGVGDYAMAVDDGTIIDAASRAPDTSSFHPVHMNHSRGRANVARYYQRGRGRIAFFTTRDVGPGEELLYNYGAAYWRTREHLELP